MERLHCPTCANEVFFDSLACVRCHTELALALDGEGALSLGDAATVGACLMRDTWRCNWRPATPGRSCASCSIVDAGEQGRNHLMVPFLSAQRRALKQLAELGVPWQPAANVPAGPPLRRPPWLE